MMQKKQMIEDVDVLVHPGFGAKLRSVILNDFLNSFPDRYTKDVFRAHYESIVGSAEIDPTLLRKLLFHVWGKRIKDIAKKPNHGAVIVTTKFTDYDINRIEGIDKLAIAQKRLISFARENLGKRLVVKEIDTIEHNPEEILNAYRNEKLIERDAKLNFVVYGEMRDRCVNDVCTAVGKIGNAKVEDSLTQYMLFRKKIGNRVLYKPKTGSRTRRNLL